MIPDMATTPSKQLETFPNPRPQRDFEIAMECPEFTCICPRTGQPDFATIRIRYVPAELCVELKSLKLYLWSYRDEGAFHEAVINRILDDLVEACLCRFHIRLSLGQLSDFSRRTYSHCFHAKSNPDCSIQLRGHLRSPLPMCQFVVTKV